MTRNELTNSNFTLRFWGIIAFCLFVFAASIVCVVFFPAEQSEMLNSTASAEVEDAGLPFIEDSLENTAVGYQNFSATYIAENVSYYQNELVGDAYKIAVAEFSQRTDTGLNLYRSVQSRTAVEWFYTHICEDRDVAVAILEAADKNDIPLSLAFALAYTESRYNVNAVNKNTNASVDRGLFQLNNKSFPGLTEAEFFDPYVSAKYGMSHLRFCLDTAGNEVSALAMYNAGTNRVRNDSTPQMTLNYVSKIISYRQGLDELFDSEVARFYQTGADQYLAAIDVAEKANGYIYN